MDPSFYRKVKRSGQKGSWEKPKKLTRKLNQRKKGRNLEEENRNKNAHSYYSDTSGSESKSQPDPNKFSKWYRIQSKGRLEIGISLVRVTGWINQFITHIRKPQKDRVSGDLTSGELKLAEEQIIKTAQLECSTHKGHRTLLGFSKAR